MTIYLLIKEHNDTGLKYLCKHVATSFVECEKYKGSGIYWRKHIKKHGYNVKTTCLFVTEDKLEFKRVAKEYSKLFNVTESTAWANLCDEEGQGGNTINTVTDKKIHGNKSKKMWQNPQIRVKLLEHLKNHCKISQPLAAKAAKEKLTGVLKTEIHKQNMRGKRPHVNQSAGKNNNAKKIQTPFGIFDSIKDAALKIDGYTYRMIWQRLQKNNDWIYIK